ncbi:hypothetical protein OS965_30060 [Streptomyces sp. H27-G5]|uniref:DUF6197 family protein n=1 Tax=Streptomyces sp. H27-G5 TaxID=2996698 RepID=UPI002270D543|nr:hypothetical protein [Streptomyces sp. H27-G5]MCY0922356.1 hypothetical protein [Streptomyces sp. H27-G5]
MAKKAVSATAPSTVLDSNVMPLDTVLRESVGLIKEDDWIGWSGELVQGAAVARHLEAAAVLLERDGWVRLHIENGPSPVPADEESMSVKEMVRQLLRMVREAMGAEKQRSLSEALADVKYSAVSDDDTWTVTMRVLDAVVRARTGSRSARHDSWAGKLGRTYAEVAELLAVGAEFARGHGPR